MADLGLADAMNPTEALLDAVGIPREVVIDHEMGALKIDAFTSCIGSKKHFDFWIVSERLLDFQPVFAPNTAVYGHYGIGASDQYLNLFLQIGQCVSMLSKDDQLLARGESIG